MWIDDVVTLTTIQSVWGNAIRDRTVFTAATVAERDTKGGALPDGALAYVAATDSLYMRRAAVAGGWRTIETPWLGYQPNVIIGSNNYNPLATYVRCVYRRVHGTTIDLDITINVGLTAGQPGALALSLPVQAYTDHGGVGSLVGSAWLLDFGAAKRWFAPATLGPNSFIGFTDPATGAQPIFGTGSPPANLSAKVRGSYQCVDG